MRAVKELLTANLDADFAIATGPFQQAFADDFGRLPTLRRKGSNSATSWTQRMIPS